MEEIPDIRVELRFVGSPRFPARLVLGAIEAVERAVMRAEVAEINELAEAFPEIPEATFDAVRYRAQQLTAQSLNFESASSGSIILAGIAAAVAYWLLDKTLGETVKQAWEASELHSRVRKFLLTRLSAKAHAIARDIRPSRWPNAREQVEVRTEDQPRAILIVVTVPLPPTLTPIPAAQEVELPQPTPTPRPR
jgi:hypothetical protein